MSTGILTQLNKLVKTRPRLLMLTGLIRLLFFGGYAAWVTPLVAADSLREHLSFDLNWKFHLGDDWPDALKQAGENKLTATAEGLTAATAVLRTQPSAARPSVP